MKKLKHLLSVICIITTILLIIILLVYWGINSELTTMQIFLKKWYIIISIPLIGGLSLYLDDNFSKEI